MWNVNILDLFWDLLLVSNFGKWWISFLHLSAGLFRGTSNIPTNFYFLAFDVTLEILDFFSWKRFSIFLIMFCMSKQFWKELNLFTFIDWRFLQIRKDPHFIPTFYFVMQRAKFPNGQNWKTARNAPETPRTLKEHNENEVSHLNQAWAACGPITNCPTTNCPISPHVSDLWIPDSSFLDSGLGIP